MIWKFLFNLLDVKIDPLNLQRVQSVAASQIKPNPAGKPQTWQPCINLKRQKKKNLNNFCLY